MKHIIEENSRRDIDRFIIEGDEDARGQESYMKRFLQMNEDILLKGESGKNLQLKMYRNIILTVRRDFDNYFLLLDLDTGDLEEKFQKIENLVKQRYQSNQGVEMDKEIIKENNHFYFFVIEGQIAHMDFRTPVIAFKKNLEAEAEINKKDPEQEKRSKVKELAKNQKIQEFVCNHFLEQIE